MNSVQFERHKKRLEKLFSNIFFILLIGFIVRLLVSFSLIGGLHADEEFQGLEMAYNLLYPSSKNIIPWEFVTQTRSYIIPLLFVPVVFLSSALNIVGLPFFQLLRFLLSLTTLLFIPLSKKIFNADEPNEKLASTIVCWFFALYFPLVLFSNYLGADGFGLFLICLLMIYFSKAKNQDPSVGKSILIGLAIGLATIIRLQYMILFLPFLLKSIVKKQHFIVVGFILGLLPLAITDYIFYNFPGITVINFFQYNVLTQKNVSLVPQSYWWLYIVAVPTLLLYFGLGIPIILFNYTKAFHLSKNLNIRLLALGALFYILFFQYLTYKEVRFLIPAVLVILYDSLQSLPYFIEYLRKYKHKNIVRLFTIFLLVSIPISFIVAPYNYDLKDNIWLAQEYIHVHDPNATIGIIDPFQMTGGYFFQYGGKTNKTIYFMDQMNEAELNKTFHLITYFINDQMHSNEQAIRQLKNSVCQTNVLVKEFTSLRQFSIDSINYQYNPNKLGVKIEVWKCN